MSEDGKLRQPLSEVKTVRKVRNNGKPYFTEMTIRGKMYPNFERDVQMLADYVRRKKINPFRIEFEEFNVVGFGKSNLLLHFDNEELKWFRKNLANGQKMMYFDGKSLLIFLCKISPYGMYTEFFSTITGIDEVNYLSEDIFEFTLY